MAQAISAAAAPRRAVLPPSKQVEKLEGRVVNDMPPSAKEALEVTAQVAEILSFLPPEEVANGALAIVPRWMKKTERQAGTHTKLGELFLRSQFREKAKVSMQEVQDLIAHFSNRRDLDDRRLLPFFLKYCPSLEVLTLRDGDYRDFKFIPRETRAICRQFKGLEIPDKAEVETYIIEHLNHRVPLRSLSYKGSEKFLDDEILNLTQLESLTIAPSQAQGEYAPIRQKFLDKIGQLPRLRELVIPVSYSLFNRFPELERLTINGCKKEDICNKNFHASVASLAKLPKLTVLTMDVDPAWDVTVFACLPHLQTFTIVGPYCHTQASRGYLKNLIIHSPKLDRIIFDQEAWSHFSNQLEDIQKEFPNISLLDANEKPLFPDLLEAKPAAQAHAKDPSVQALA